MERTLGAVLRNIITGVYRGTKRTCRGASPVGWVLCVLEDSGEGEMCIVLIIITISITITKTKRWRREKCKAEEGDYLYLCLGCLVTSHTSCTTNHMSHTTDRFTPLQTTGYPLHVTHHRQAHTTPQHRLHLAAPCLALVNIIKFTRIVIRRWVSSFAPQISVKPILHWPQLIHFTKKCSLICPWKTVSAPSSAYTYMRWRHDVYGYVCLSLR